MEVQCRETPPVAAEPSAKQLAKKKMEKSQVKVQYMVLDIQFGATLGMLQEMNK